jgi:hypothetical protein
MNVFSVHDRDDYQEGESLKMWKKTKSSLEKGESKKIRQIRRAKHWAI